MLIEPLTLVEIREVYRGRLVHDFPKNERKSLQRIESSLKKGLYQCFGYKNGPVILAYAFFVTIGRCYLLDYFAVREAERGKGIGSAFLQKLHARLAQSADCCLLEAEDPAFAKDDEVHCRRVRRLDFYFSNGLIDTGVRAETFGVNYILLEMPMKMPSEKKDVVTVYSLIYSSILPRRLFSGMVRITES